MRIHQQTERNEHHNLEEPRITVEEGGQALLEHYLVVADHQSGDIDGQVTVAVHEVGQREDEIHQREQEYRIERFVVQVDMVEHIDGEPAEQVSAPIDICMTKVSTDCHTFMSPCDTACTRIIVRM